MDRVRNQKDYKNKVKKQEKTKREKEISQNFLLLAIITFCLNVILIAKNKDLLTFIILLMGALTELAIIYNIIKNNTKILRTNLHNIYLFLIILGSLLLNNIYLSFIILILLMTFITREYYGVCFFWIDKPKTINGTLTILSLFIIILLRILFQKQFKNLLKF